MVKKLFKIVAVLLLAALFIPFTLEYQLEKSEDQGTTSPPELMLTQEGVKIIDRGDSIQYVIQASIEGGRISGTLKPEDFTLDGSFQDAQILSVAPGIGGESFYLAILKAPIADESRVHQSNLTLEANHIKSVQDGKLYQESLSLSVPDHAVPSQERFAGVLSINGVSIDNTIEDRAAEKGYEALQEIAESPQDFYEGTSPYDQSFHTLFLSSEDLLNQIKKITDSIETSRLTDDEKQQLDTLLEVAEYLQKSQYKWYNKATKEAIEKVSAEEPEAVATLKSTLQSVYNSANKNTAYYNAFLEFEKVFKVSQPMLSKSLTFKNLSKSEALMQQQNLEDTLGAFYHQGYTTLMAALKYDYAYHEEEGTATEEWAKELEHKTKVLEDAGMTAEAATFKHAAGYYQNSRVTQIKEMLEDTKDRIEGIRP